MSVDLLKAYALHIKTFGLMYYIKVTKIISLNLSWGI